MHSIKLSLQFTEYVIHRICRGSLFGNAWLMLLRNIIRFLIFHILILSGISPSLICWTTFVRYLPKYYRLILMAFCLSFRVGFFDPNCLLAVYTVIHAVSIKSPKCSRTIVWAIWTIYISLLERYYKNNLSLLFFFGFLSTEAMLFSLILFKYRLRFEATPFLLLETLISFWIIHTISFISWALTLYDYERINAVIG